MIANRFKRCTVLKRLSCCPCLTMFRVIAVQDQNLLDKLSTGDLIATRSHVPYTMSQWPCTTQVKQNCKGSDEWEDSTPLIRVWLLLSWIEIQPEDARADNEHVPLFKLAYLFTMYSTRWELTRTCLSLDWSCELNTLKDEILPQCSLPELADS